MNLLDARPAVATHVITTLVQRTFRPDGLVPGAARSCQERRQGGRGIGAESPRRAPGGPVRSFTRSLARSLAIESQFLQYSRASVELGPYVLPSRVF